MAVKSSSSKMNLESLLLGAAIVLFPFIKTSQETLLDFELLPKQLFVGIIAIVFLGLALKEKAKYAIINPASGSLLLFLAASFISMSSAINSAEAWGTIAKTMAYTGVFFGLVHGFYTKKLDLKTVALGGTIFCFLVGFISLPEIVKAYSRSKTLDALYGLKELYVHKNFLASALFLGLPMAVITVLRKEKPWRIFSIVTIVVVLIDIALLRTRSIYLALVVSTVFVIALYQLFSFKKELSQKFLKIGGISVVGFVAIVIIVISSTSISESFFNTGNLSLRYKYWDSSIKMVQESPVTGIGAGNWRINFAKHGLRGMNKAVADGYATINRPHNDILWVFSETGIIGIVGFLGFIGFSLWYNLRTAQSTEDENEKLIHLLAAAGIIGFVVYGLFEFPLERPEHFFFLMLYTAFGTGVYLQKRDSNKSPVPVPAILGLMLVASIFGTYVINTRLGSAKDAKKAVDAFGQRNPRGMLTNGQSAVQEYYSLDDFGNPLAFFEGMGKLAQQNTKGAKDAFMRALEAHPYHILSNIQLGNAYRTENNLNEALSYYNAALRISPFNEQALLNRIEVELLSGDWNAALFDLKMMPPNERNGRYMNALKETLVSYYQRPPDEEHAGLNAFLKGARNADELAQKFLSWKKRTLEKQKKRNLSK